MIKYFLPRLKDILFISLFSAVIFFGPRIFNLDGDLGRHITIGNVIIEDLNIPTQDMFSHTMKGESVTPHEWIAQLVFALADRGYSLAGVVFFTALLIASVFLIVYHDSKERSKTYLLSFIITIFAAFSSSLHWLARPHIFSFFYLAIWAYFLEQYRRDKKVPIWKFALIMLFWANTHGAFIAAFVTWGAYFVDELINVWSKHKRATKKLKAWGSIGIVSFLITFINPVGYHLWETNFDFLKSNYLVGHTQEYLSPDFHNPSVMPFLLLIAFSLFLISRKEKPIPLVHGFLLSGWTIMGLYSARNIPLYAIISAPILSEISAEILLKTRWFSIERTVKKNERRLKGFLLPLLASLIVFLTLSTPFMQSYNSYDAKKFPVNATTWLNENEQEGNMFNHFTWGGYLLYKKYPNKLVFIDGQTDFYGEALTQEYEQIITLSDGWEEILDKYQVSWVIIPASSPLEMALENVSWEILYKDETTTIMRRD